MHNIRVPLKKMTKNIVSRVITKTNGLFRTIDIKTHYTYIQDKVLSKIAFKALYRVQPDCLTHYWDTDGPTFCPRSPISFEVLPDIDLTLLRAVRDCMYEAHFEEKGLMQYINFFRMLPLLQIYKY